MTAETHSAATAMAAASKPTARLWSVFPGVYSLRSITSLTLRADAIAGLTLAAYMLPAGILATPRSPGFNRKPGSMHASSAVSCSGLSAVPAIPL